MNLELARFNMIEQQIRPWEVLDPAVISILGSIRREDFVPPTHRALAFADTQVPLLPGAPNGACMLEPKIEAKLLQELKVQHHERALEIGAGSGFMAALLARRAAEVTTLEIHPELAAMARANLQRAGFSKVQVVQADGAAGLPAAGPFDVILLSGSVAAVPQNLLEQLRVGGRLAAIVGHLPIMQAKVWTRSAPSSWSEEVVFETVAPRLLNFPTANPFKF
ncbi:MAG: protein-L-isoaspartate(D-aspartate) O-methyltransferase Pcm [Pseudomonadota bacterium]|jgi:protein-L-isoaspartate(D-aspartate) O-methyltransferase